MIFQQLPVHVCIISFPSVHKISNTAILRGSRNFSKRGGGLSRKILKEKTCVHIKTRQTCNAFSLFPFQWECLLFLLFFLLSFIFEIWRGGYYPPLPPLDPPMIFDHKSQDLEYLVLCMLCYYCIFMVYMLDILTRSPWATSHTWEKTVQINKHIWLSECWLREEKPIIYFMRIEWFFTRTNLNPLHPRT